MDMGVGNASGGSASWRLSSFESCGILCARQRKSLGILGEAKAMPKASEGRPGGDIVARRPARRQDRREWVFLLQSKGQ